MIKDIFCYYEKDVPTVYNAYLRAVSVLFKKEVRTLEYHTISFNLGFSWIYNMNGGTCEIYFIQHENGTAVALHYNVLQMVGARFDKHFGDINKHVVSVILTGAMPVNMNMNMFLNTPNIVFKQTAASQTTTVNTPGRPYQIPVEERQASKQQEQKTQSRHAPFVFLSYSHKDSNIVLPWFDMIKSVGIPIWYDDGIRAGYEWEDEIIKNLSRSSAFIFFVSRNSLSSVNCKDELYSARSQGKRFINILIENFDFTLPEYEWFNFRYSRYQQIPAYSMSKEDVIQKIHMSLEDI